MTSRADVVFLFDVDNTLLDNDRVTDDLRTHLVEEFGKKSADHYWALFEELRAELGYTDYLGALQRYRQGLMNDPDLLMMSSFLLEYPFADRLYPGALDVLRRSEEHTSELQSLMRISYAVFCLTKHILHQNNSTTQNTYQHLL